MDAVLLVNHHGNERANPPSRQEVFDDSCSWNHLGVHPAVKEQQKVVRLAVRSVARWRVNPEAAFVAENLAAQALHVGASAWDLRPRPEPCGERRRSGKLHDRADPIAILVVQDIAVWIKWVGLQ